jgi:zinc/manganese transport system permease protein
MGIGLLSSYAGLLLSFYIDLPSGPSIILTAGLCYVFSVAFGRHGSLYKRRGAGGHLTG